MIWRTLKRAHRCQQSPESLDKCRFYHSPDPPKSPLRRGTLTPPVPPFLRGARGDLDLIVKQQSLTGFELVVDTYGQCRVPTVDRARGRDTALLCPTFRSFR